MENRKKNTGKKHHTWKGILAFAVNRLLTKGRTPTLEVLDWNEKAIRLYESQGFTTHHRRSLYRWDFL